MTCTIRDRPELVVSRLMPTPGRALQREDVSVAQLVEDVLDLQAGGRNRAFDRFHRRPAN